MLVCLMSQVTEAEQGRRKSEENHKRRASKFAELEARKLELENKYARSIKKARPYFKLKEELDVKLMVTYVYTLFLCRAFSVP